MSVQATGYSPTVRALHWGSAALIMVLVGSGLRAGLSDDPATKFQALQVHLPVAILVLALTVARLVNLARGLANPPPLVSVPAWQAGLAHWVHRLIYAALLALLASGIAMSVLSGLPGALYGGAPMPELTDLPPRLGHRVAAIALGLLLAGHVGAALYHHFVLKDATLQRIWRGRGE
jgi:cytochrome b561